MTRTGRPTDNPKTFSKLIRLSKKEKMMLEQCAKKTGKNQSDVLMMGLGMVCESLGVQCDE